MAIYFQWYGTNSLALTIGEHRLWIDPFFTRPPAYAMFQRIACDTACVARMVDRADTVLVTHPHYDHLLDVPEVLRLTGARAYGSPVAAALLRRQGIDAGQALVVQVGQQIDLAYCQVDVLPAWHTYTPLDRWINGPTSDEQVAGMRLPLRLIDYRMDVSYSYRIHVDGRKILIGNAPVEANVVFISPYLPEALLRELLTAARPQYIVLIHWDDFTRPLSQPLLPMLVTRGHGLGGWRPVGRLDPQEMQRRLRMICPEAIIVLPEIRQTNRL